MMYNFPLNKEYNMYIQQLHWDNVGVLQNNIIIAISGMFMPVYERQQDVTGHESCPTQKSCTIIAYTA